MAFFEIGVGKGGTDIVNLLLEFHKNPNQRNKENTYPVHSAARTGDLETLQLLHEVCIVLYFRGPVRNFSLWVPLYNRGSSKRGFKGLYNSEP